MVNLEDACLGDAAEDAAALSLSAGFSPEQESDFLDAYLKHLTEIGRPDPRFLLRFFPRRFLLQLQAPVAALDRMMRLKRGEAAVVTDQVAALEDMMERTYQSLSDAMNGLRGFIGGMREVLLREVKGMGRLIAYEELLLRDRKFRIVITGLPYAGKTEVGAALARRLSHNYLNTSVLGRALAAFHLMVPGHEEEDLSVDARVRLLFEAGFVTRPLNAPPYYAAFIGEREVTDLLRSDEVALEGASQLDEEAVQSALRDEITHRFAAGGVVIEGAYADRLAPGRARIFHIVSDSTVRQARLMNHRHDVSDEEQAAALLNQLDEGAATALESATIVDVGARPAGSAALAVLWHLLPESRRPDLDQHRLNGRAPLYP